MDYSERRTQDRRLVILRLLSEEPQYQINESLIQDLLAEFGHSESRDVLRSDLAWLSEQGLVTLKSFSDVQIATLTTRGNDVAHGRAVVPGVKRPSPR